MPFDPINFYNLADWLVGQKKDESSLRTAIGRVYYAGHHIAKDKLIQKGWEPKGTGADHGGVIRELKQRKVSKLGNQLQVLRELREHADYHLEASNTVYNQYCKYCADIRKISSSSDPVVRMSHWEETEQISKRFFPQISNY